MWKTLKRNEKLYVIISLLFYISRFDSWYLKNLFKCLFKKKPTFKNLAWYGNIVDPVTLRIKSGNFCDQYTYTDLLFYGFNPDKALIIEDIEYTISYKKDGFFYSDLQLETV